MTSLTTRHVGGTKIIQSPSTSASQLHQPHGRASPRRTSVCRGSLLGHSYPVKPKAKAAKAVRSGEIFKQAYLRTLCQNSYQTDLRIPYSLLPSFTTSSASKTSKKPRFVSFLLALSGLLLPPSTIHTVPNDSAKAAAGAHLCWSPGRRHLLRLPGFQGIDAGLSGWSREVRICLFFGNSTIILSLFFIGGTMWCSLS